MGKRFSISGWTKKIKHNEKLPPKEKHNDTDDKECEKINKFLEIIDCYNNINNKR